MVVTTEREWLTVLEFAQRHTRLSRNFIYELCAKGQLLSIKVGGRVLVASDALDVVANQRREA